MSQQPDSKTKSKVARLAGQGLQFVAFDIPVISGAITLVSAIVMPIYGVYAHRAAKRELKALWIKADQLGLSGQDLKRLSGTADFGALDWELTHDGKATLPLDLVRAVNAKLDELR